MGFVNNYEDFIKFHAQAAGMTREEWMAHYGVAEGNAKPGPDAYMTGLNNDEEDKKKEKMKKQAEMDDDDPDAYKEMPGDKEARKEGQVKKSKHVSAYHKLYGEDLDESTMSDIHQMAGEAKSKEDFLKMFFKEYGAKVKKTKDSEEWAASLYDDMNESKVNEMAMGYDAMTGLFYIEGVPFTQERLEQSLKFLRTKLNLGKLPKQFSYFPALQVADNEAMEMVTLDLQDAKKLEDHLKRFKGKLASDKDFNESNQVSEKKDSPFDKLNKLADEYYSTFGFANLDADYMDLHIDIKKADKIAKKVYGEFGFASLPEDDMEELINRNPKLVRESEEHDSMAYGQLERIIDYATMLRERFDNGYMFDAWMHGKITKAKSYLNSVFDALDGGDGVMETQKMTKKDWKKIKPFNKHITKDGTKFVMSYNDSIGTFLEPVEIVDESKFSPLGYAKQVVNGEITLKDAMKEAGISLSNISKLIKKLDKSFDIDTAIMAEKYREVRHEVTDFSKPGNDGDIYFSKREGDAVGVRLGDALQMIYVFQKEPKLGKIQKSDKRWENMGPASEKLLIDLRGREEGKILFKFVSAFEVNEAKLNEEKAEGDRGKIDDAKIETALAKKADETGVPIGLIRIVMRRGMAAWKTGHRPGAGQQQWGYARVNSFLTKQPGTWGDADSDVAKEVRDGGHDKKLKKA